MVRRRATRHHRNDDDHLSFLAELATFYYVDRLNQEQIAQQIGLSVSMVSRLLTEAYERGIVEVRVRHSVPTVPELQAALVQRFRLRAARVLRSAGQDPQRLLARLGELGARYLKAILTDGAIVGIGWGRTLHEVVLATSPGSAHEVQVVQSLGSLGSRLPSIDNRELTRLLAERLHATPHYLPAPMIVESEAVRRALVQDPQLRGTLALAHTADIMMLGIGVPEPEHSGLLHAGYIDAPTLESIRATGVVGDMFVNYFDRTGHARDPEVSERVVGVRLADMQQVGTVIAVAGGLFKADAILGALRTRLIHVLVTDDATAEAVLRLADQYPVPEESPPTSPEHSKRSRRVAA
jgi:deoxyribonucleoside regulator